MTKQKQELSPAKAGDIVLLRSVSSSRLSKRESYELVKVTKVDADGRIRRFKERPHHNAEEVKGRTLYVIHQDDRVARRLHVALWKASNLVSWDSPEAARAGIDAGIAQLQEA